MKRDQPENDFGEIGPMSDEFRTILVEKNKRIKVLENFLESEIDGYFECTGCKKPKLYSFECVECSGNYCYDCRDLFCVNCDEPGCNECCNEWKYCVKCEGSYCQECQYELAEISYFTHVCSDCSFKYLKEKEK